LSLSQAVHATEGHTLIDYISRLLGLGSEESALEKLAKIISRNDTTVVQSVRRFVSSPNAFFESLDEDIKEDCLIETIADISTAFVLGRPLYKAGYIIIADNREESISVLNKLNKLSGRILESSPLYSQLSEFYNLTNWGFGSLVGGPGSIEHSPTIFDCAKAVNLSLLAIDCGGDALNLFFCASEDKIYVSKLAKSSGIRLYFEEM
jgi:hypothetical protein